MVQIGMIDMDWIHTQKFFFLLSCNQLIAEAQQLIARTCLGQADQAPSNVRTQIQKKLSSKTLPDQVSSISASSFEAEPMLLHTESRLSARGVPFFRSLRVLLHINSNIGHESSILEDSPSAFFLCRTLSLLVRHKHIN